jgi:hypothetical protein
MQITIFFAFPMTIDTPCLPYLTRDLFGCNNIVVIYQPFSASLKSVMKLIKLSKQKQTSI